MMDKIIKEGHWICKGAKIDYLVAYNSDNICYAYCINTKNKHLLDTDIKINNFLRNHKLIEIDFRRE